MEVDLKIDISNIFYIGSKQMITNLLLNLFLSADSFSSALQVESSKGELFDKFFLSAL